jgi:hypothetical protein
VIIASPAPNIQFDLISPPPFTRQSQLLLRVGDERGNFRSGENA